MQRPGGLTRSKLGPTMPAVAVGDAESLFGLTQPGWGAGAC